MQVWGVDIFKWLGFLSAKVWVDNETLTWAHFLERERETQFLVVVNGVEEMAESQPKVLFFVVRIL